MTDSYDVVEESPMTYSSNCTLKESPAMTYSKPGNPEVDSPMSKTGETREQESPMTLYQRPTREVTSDLTAKTKSLPEEAKS